MKECRGYIDEEFNFVSNIDKTTFTCFDVW